jgi:hypothetical protein
MEATGIVALVAGLLNVVGAVFAFHGLRVFGRTRRFVAASASAKGTVSDSVGRWYSDPGDDPGVSKLSHPVVRFQSGEARGSSSSPSASPPSSSWTRERVRSGA